LNRSKATTKLTKKQKENLLIIYIHFILLVIRYSLDEFRRIFVEEKTFMESKEPIIPEEIIFNKIKKKMNFKLFSYQQ